MRELVERDILPRELPTRPGKRAVPGDDHRPSAVLREPEDSERVRGDGPEGRAGPHAGGLQRGRVHDDAAHQPVVVRSEREDEQRGLGGDDDADCVVEVEAACRLPPLGGQQAIGQLEQPRLLVAGQQRPGREVLLHDRRTARRQSPSAQSHSHRSTGVSARPLGSAIPRDGR